MSATQFVCEGQLYVRCKPATWMENSKLIKDHVARGDIFAVNLGTGELTVFDSQLVTTLINTGRFTVPSAEEQKKNVVDVQMYRNKLRAIVREARGALGE